MLHSSQNLDFLLGVPSAADTEGYLPHSHPSLLPDLVHPPVPCPAGSRLIMVVSFFWVEMQLV